MTGARVALAAVLLLVGASFGRAAEPASPFEDWAAVVIAADWRSGDGKPIDAFDNARRDLADAYVKAGFRPGNLRQYSLRPARLGDPKGLVTDGPTALAGLREAARRAEGGCLVHLTSHGDPSGIVFGPEGRLPPRGLAVALAQACGDRPTVVVVSACFSGVFLPALAGPNRMVMTAARPDRSSFGCSEDDRYPFFDQCVLEALPASRDFLALGRSAKACVARMETERKLKPASEPQTYVGADMQALLSVSPFPGR